MPLSNREREMLDFERTWWSQPGSKEQAIRRILHISPTRYYAALAALVETNDAMEYDPLVVRRVRRDREQRRRARWEGRPAGGSR